MSILASADVAGTADAPAQYSAFLRCDDGRGRPWHESSALQVIVADR